MELTPTGIGILIIFAVAMLRSKGGALLLLFTFFVPFSATAIVNLHSLSFSITPYHLFGGMLVMSALISWLKCGIGEVSFDFDSPFLWMMTFIIYILVWMFGTAVTGGINIGVLLQTAMLLFGLMVTWALAETINSMAVARKMAITYLLSAMFVALWGIIQGFCLNTGIQFPDDIFNNSISQGVHFDQVLKNLDFTVHRISSVTLEPSYFTRFLCPAVLFTIVLLGEGVGPPRLLRGCLVIFIGAVLLSTSTIGYLGMALAVAAAVFLYAQRLLPLFGIIGAAASVVLLSMPKVLETVRLVTVDKGESGSYEIRMQSIENGLQGFFSAPFVGHGWGWYAGTSVHVVHDFLFKMLSSVGVIGTSVFMLYIITGVAQPLAALRRLRSYSSRYAIDAAVNIEVAQLRALTLGFAAAFAMIFVLDALATFSYFIGQQWFLLGAMVGLSRVATAWAAQYDLPRMVKPAATLRAEAG